MLCILIKSLSVFKYTHTIIYFQTFISRKDRGIRFANSASVVVTTEHIISTCVDSHQRACPSNASAVCTSHYRLCSQDQLVLYHSVS